MPITPLPQPVPSLTPEQRNRVENQALDKRAEQQAAASAKQETQRTLAVDYTEQRQSRAAMARYLETSGNTSTTSPAPEPVDIYQASRQFQRQERLSQAVSTAQSSLGERIIDLYQGRPEPALIDTQV
ncbi:hypothetical protein G114_16800 [Aeromonas diversa CDC 2478-85]|uniref:Uncharacterized protein n=1 Tax=Aeromonas diversa CDC 2478-85 TaxID=1268237 RepID=N9TX93_9GAMM|nr:hypothetical protein [Aeromonas diversa]ENY70734.1 hypothetical protein G114_16800 [Aeromonas diversa CDC 2478-85]